MFLNKLFFKHSRRTPYTYLFRGKKFNSEAIYGVIDNFIQNKHNHTVFLLKSSSPSKAFVRREKTS